MSVGSSRMFLVCLSKINQIKMTNTPFDIIAFTAQKPKYFPASMEKEDWMEDDYVAHTEIDIPLGQSRYGGPVVDLPEGIEAPDGLEFAAQLDLAQFAPHDKSGLLPKSGQLIIFADISSDLGTVIYADVPNDKLVRHIVEQEENFWEGTLINKIYSDTETWQERFRDLQDEHEKEFANINANGKVWNDYGGIERSKIFGIFTDSNIGEEQVRKMTDSSRVILLQVGENGFNEEGVFSVLIEKEDLINRKFDDCEFYWT